jgi:hypothetical protein
MSHLLPHVSQRVGILPLSSSFSLIALYQATRNNGVPFHAKRTKNPPLTRGKPRTLHLEREVNPEEAEADVVDVAALVVVAVALLLPAVVTATLTATILTLVALLHLLLQMVTLPFPLIPGGNHLRSPALIPTPAGAAPQRLKPVHGVAPLNRPGVHPQPLMAQQPLLLLSSRSPFLLLDPLSRLPPPPSFHGHKSPGAYPSFPLAI